MAKITEGMQGLMEDFLQAKRSFYGWDDETFNKKAVNFKNNIRKVKFCPKAQGGNIKGRYSYIGKKVILAMDGNRVDTADTKAITHELNHAFNDEPGNRMNLLKKRGKRISRDMKKYNLLSEIINEAETQVLFDNAVGDENRKFGLYSDAQPMFEMLCNSCNQDASTFLRDIEGKNIDELVQHISLHSGHDIEESQKYIDDMAEELKAFSKSGLEDFQFVDGEQIVYRKFLEINERFLNSSTLDQDMVAEMKETLTYIKGRPFYEYQKN